MGQQVPNYLSPEDANIIALFRKYKAARDALAEARAAYAKVCTERDAARRAAMDVMGSAESAYDLAYKELYGVTE